MLTNDEIGHAKGFLKLGHKQHDIAAHFGCNGGRIAEIATGQIGGDIAPTPVHQLPKVRQLQRFFTPSQALEEQVEILLDLISTAKTNEPSRVHLITPQLAQWILEKRHGIGNRKASSVKVEEYESAMSEDWWRVTGATLVFGKLGHLIDGQHRLLACVRSGQPFYSYLVFGIDDAVFTLIDIGRKRSNVDAFSIAGIPYATVSAHATRWISILEEDPTARHTQLTNEEALQFYRKNVDQKLFDECVQIAVKIEKEVKAFKTKVPAAPVAALLYLFSGKSKKDAKGFANLMLENKNQARSAFSALRKATIDSGGRINETFRNAILINAWNAYREARAVTVVSVRWDSATPYPEIS
jgi:hypothetical protein